VPIIANREHRPVAILIMLSHQSEPPHPGRKLRQMCI